MNCVAGMIVDLLLSALFLSAAPLRLLVLLLKLVLEQKPLFSSVYFTSRVFDYTLTFSASAFHRIVSVTFMWTHTLYYFNLCSRSSVKNKYWETQTLLDTWGGRVSSLTHQIHSVVQEAAPARMWQLPINADTDQYHACILALFPRYLCIWKLFTTILWTLLRVQKIHIISQY